MRLVRDDVPGAYVDVTAAVTFNERTGRYAPEAQIYYGIRKPDDTDDEWQDIIYESDHLCDYETAEEAEPYAERIVRDYAANAAVVSWDGVSREDRSG